MMKDKPSGGVALYARVSTTNHNQDADMQLRDMRGFTKLRGQRITEEYVDHGISGTKKKRPALDRLMADAEEGKFGTVMVWKFDRFARSAIHLAEALEKFKALGIEFVSMNEQFDTSSPMGEAMLTIIGAIGKLERDMIRERICAGLRNRRAKGDHIGPPGAKRITQQMFDHVHRLRNRKRKVTYQAIGDQLGLSAMTVWKLARRKQL